MGPFSEASNKYKELIHTAKGGKEQQRNRMLHCVSTGPLIPGYLQILVSHASQAPFWKVSLDHFPDGETQGREK